MKRRSSALPARLVFALVLLLSVACFAGPVARAEEAGDGPVSQVVSTQAEAPQNSESAPTDVLDEGLMQEADVMVGEVELAQHDAIEVDTSQQTNPDDALAEASIPRDTEGESEMNLAEDPQPTPLDENPTFSAGALARELALAPQAMSVTLPSNYPNNALGEPAPTGSYNTSPYARWESPSTSYLYLNSSGNPERVEYLNSKLIVETLSSDFHRIMLKRVIDRNTYVPSNLASDSAFSWGGFFSGSQYNFVVTGQDNPNEDNNCVVFRVSIYDKSWNYVASTEFRGHNTTVPFDAGSCDFAESNSTLHIRTSHEMYTSDDGLNHQANVHITINLSSFAGTAQTDVSNQYQNSHGYVSHSFGQRLTMLNSTLYALDHGDAHPRAITLKRYGSIDPYYGTHNSVHDIITFPGTIGENYTGLNMGGFESSSARNTLLTSGVFVGLDNYEIEGWLASKARNAYVSVTPANFNASSSSTVRYLTSYASNSNRAAGNAKLVKIGEDRFLVAWGILETDSSSWYSNFKASGRIGYVFVDGNGNPTSQTYEADAMLSEVEPVVVGDYVAWYTPDFDDNNRPIYYGIGTSSEQLEILSQVPLSEVDVAAIPAETFDYKAHTPKPSLSFQGTTLAEGSYYTISSYQNNVNAGTAKIVLSAAPNQKRFKGTRTINFTIKRRNLSETNVGTIAKLTYTGSALTPVPTVSYNGTKLTHNTDFTTSYTNNTKVGTATVKLTGKGNFTGSVSTTFTIVGDLASSHAAIASMAARTYTGSQHKPAPKVSFAGTSLSANTDYTVSYKNNVNAGTATVTVTGKGLYKGSKSITFKINPKSISKASVSAAAQTYTGSALKPKPNVSLDGVTLTSGTDFTSAYTNNINAGSATITVTGKGNYTGTATGSFTIKRASIAKATVTAQDQIWTGSALKPAPTVSLNSKTLKSGTEYSVSYASNTEVGTASITVTGKGNYTGTAKTTFSIKPKSLSKASISGLSTKTYTGSAHKPTPVVKLDGVTLVAKSDYTVSYKNNLNAGTATVTITGKGHYTDSARATFKINPLTLTGATIDEIPVQAWTGKEVKPSVVVKQGKTTLVEGTDYTLSYSKNIEPGQATVTIIGKGNYSGTLTQSFEIRCKILPMYRLYNPNSGEHFYTASAGERDHLVKVGWRYEGIGWYAPEWSHNPVYRLYNANAGDHHYTMSAAERDMLIKVGWRYEGIGWYSDDAKGVALYRQYNPNARAGSHNYTTNKAENDMLVRVGWKAEGIGWYGVKNS